MIGKFETLNSAKSELTMKGIIATNGSVLPNLSGDYLQIRSELISLYNDIFPTDGKNLTPYQVDVLYGIKLKSYLEGKDWFNLRLAANVDFWRYLSVMVIPTIVARRYDYIKEDYYWKRSSRIWLRSIWAYCVFSWQGSEEKTRNLLLDSRFNVDVKQNLVERTGKHGTNILHYRYNMTAFSLVPLEKIKDFDSHTKRHSDTLFRSVMRLNTAELMVKEPELCEGGVPEYVAFLFKKYGIDVDFNFDDNPDRLDDRSTDNSAIEEPKGDTDPIDMETALDNLENVETAPSPEESKPTHCGRITVIKGDITTLKVDAIVNAANSCLRGGSGVDGSIHNAAGPDLEEACASIGSCAVGNSCITGGFNLPCKYIIHTVGPNCNIYDQDQRRAVYLRSCYNSCLDLAKNYHIKSIAFSCISTGNYSYPRRDAAIVALDTIKSRLKAGLNMDVIICCYTQEDKDIYDSLINK